MDAWRSGERCRRAFGGGGAFGALASLRSRMASAAAWASSSDNAPAAYAFHSSADRWSSWGVRAAAMARVRCSTNIESAFRAVTRRGRSTQAKRERGAKRRLHRFRFSGKITTATSVSFPGFAGHRPAFHGGFCVSRLRESPRPAPGCGQLLMYRYFRNSVLIDLLPELFPPGFRERERTQA